MKGWFTQNIYICWKMPLEQASKKPRVLIGWILDFGWTVHHFFSAVFCAKAVVFFLYGGSFLLKEGKAGCYHWTCCTSPHRCVWLTWLPFWLCIIIVYLYRWWCRWQWEQCRCVSACKLLLLNRAICATRLRLLHFTSDFTSCLPLLPFKSKKAFFKISVFFLGLLKNKMPPFTLGHIDAEWFHFFSLVWLL